MSALSIRRVCARCDGRGLVPLTPTFSQKCPACRGTGLIPVGLDAGARPAITDEDTLQGDSSENMHQLSPSERARINAAAEQYECDRLAKIRRQVLRGELLWNGGIAAVLVLVIAAIFTLVYLSGHRP